MKVFRKKRLALEKRVGLVILWYLQMMDWILQTLLRDMSQRKGSTVMQVSMIIDVSGIGLSFWNHSMQNWLKGVLRLGNVLYGEMLYQVYIVNVPWVASKLWGLVTHFLHPVTASKFHLMSSSEMHKVLRQYPLEALPRWQICLTRSNC